MTTPLSRLEANSTSARSGESPSETPRSQDEIDSRLDQYIDSVSDKIEQQYAETDDEPRERKDIDTLIREAAEKASRAEEDYYSEERGRVHREVLERRNGRSVNDQIGSLSKWIQAFQADPGLSANALVEHY